MQTGTVRCRREVCRFASNCSDIGGWRLQRDDATQFLCEVPAATPVAEALTTVVRIQNQLQRIRRCRRYCFLGLLLLIIQPSITSACASSER